jgi:hypothetical protein
MRGGAVLAALVWASCAQEPLYDGRFCGVDSPCPEGFECLTGTCHRVCAINEQCILPSEVCVSGVCTPLAGGEDVDAGAGKDSGVLDGASSVPDASAFTECLTPSDCQTPGPCDVPGTATCEDGECRYRRVECVDPPPAECADNDTLFRTYSNIGSCDDSNGQCDYTVMGVPCADCVATCLQPCSGIACDDTNGGCRTTGFCMPGAPGTPPTCEYQNAEDGIACTQDDGSDGVCSAGECVGCVDAADCDDLNPCTADVCDTTAKTCSHPPVAAGCDDGNECTQTDVCMGGMCLGMDPIDCTTGAPECYDSGACNPATGQCEYPQSPAGASCTDSNACTQTDGCQSGNCVGGNPIVCNSPPGQCFDAAGTCNPSNGNCNYPASPTTRSCDDSNLCSHTDRCDGSGGCRGTSYSCNDNNICTSDACNGTGGCSNARIATTNLNPSGGAVVSTMDVTMTWADCADAQTYEVEIDWQRGDGTWADYFTYTNEPNPSKTFFPCSNAAPGLPCNGDFRFRVRAHNGSSFGPWSPFVVWHWNNCRTC